MTSEGLGEVFKGDSADTCAPENFLSCRWGGRANGQACADIERGPPSARAEYKEKIDPPPQPLPTQLRPTKPNITSATQNLYFKLYWVQNTMFSLCFFQSIFSILSVALSVSFYVHLSHFQPIGDDDADMSATNFRPSQ